MRQKLCQDDVGSIRGVETSISHDGSEHVLFLIEVPIRIETDSLPKDRHTLVGHPSSPGLSTWD